MTDQITSRAAIPRSLARAKPSSAVLEAHRRAFARVGCGGGSEKALTRIIRRTAHHEAAHAVAHWEFGLEVLFASIRPTGDLNGRVRVALRWEDHIEDAVRALLAGPIVDLVSSTDVDELEESDRDIFEAVKLLGDHAGIRLPELWDETVVFVTHPRIWRAIVRVADELLRRGQLKGNDLEVPINKTSRQSIDGLSEARVRVLGLEAPYDFALENALATHA